MTTDHRAEFPRQREARPAKDVQAKSFQAKTLHANNFHAPAAFDSYGRHFTRIGIASVAAAAAQMGRERVTIAERRDLPAILLQDSDAA